MTIDDGTSAVHIERLERDAEMLVGYQLDFLAQLEVQLREVRKTMRDIEKLRAGSSRVGPELTNGERTDTLNHLAHAVAVLDAHIAGQHECCADMQETIDQMRERLAGLRPQVQPRDESPDSMPTGQAR